MTKKEIDINKIYPEMVFVQGGAFTIGNNKSAYDREKSEKDLVLSDFHIGKYPITNREYAIFLNAYGSDSVLEGKYKGERMIETHRWGIEKDGKDWHSAIGYEKHPVIKVSWYGAYVYCQWLGESYALASEAEWEYAARGGIHNQFYNYPYAGSNQLKEVGWYRDNSQRETKPVGLKLPNSLGIYDMSGNVWEWCQDAWVDNYKDLSKSDEAREKEGELGWVIRGGSWVSNGYFCRVSNRNRDDANNRINSISFRVVRY